MCSLIHSVDPRLTPKLTLIVSNNTGYKSERHHYFIERAMKGKKKEREPQIAHVE